MEETKEQEDQFCPICHDLLDRTVNYTIAQCGHAFHAHCLIQWARRPSHIQLKKEHKIDQTDDGRMPNVSPSCPCCVHPLINEKKYVDEHGDLHRDDGPALVDIYGAKCWYQHGQLHREDGPAVEYVDGETLWIQHNQLHRVHGPARTVPNWRKEWHQHGRLHREDGPAIEQIYGDRVVTRWYYQGKRWHCTLFGYHL